MEEGAEMEEIPPAFSFHLNITSSRTAWTIITRFSLIVDVYITWSFIYSLAMRHLS